MYTSLEDAKTEIHARWNDQALKAEVEQYLSDIPAQFASQPRAVLFRNIISSTTELIHFLRQADEINLPHLGAEYLEDKFCTRNTDKMRLLKMGMIQGRDRNGDVIYVNRVVADIKANDNKPFKQIKTHDGESLADFHHRMIEEYGIGAIDMLDMSGWIKTNCSGGGGAANYYKKFLALFICHGVLFETFVTSESESEFTKVVVKPAFEWVRNFFGVRPLVVQNLPSADYRYWLAYPGEVLAPPADAVQP